MSFLCLCALFSCARVSAILNDACLSEGDAAPTSHCKAASSAAGAELMQMQREGRRAQTVVESSGQRRAGITPDAGVTKGTGAKKELARFYSSRKTQVNDGPAAPFQALCSADTVWEACLDLNEGIDDFATPGWITKSVLQYRLSANKSVMTQLFDALMLIGTPVKCNSICEGVVSYLKNVTTLPNSTDRACWVGLDQEVRCDVDVSPQALAKVNIKGDLPRNQDTFKANGQQAGLLQLGQVQTRFHRLRRFSNGTVSTRRVRPHQGHGNMYTEQSGRGGQATVVRRIKTRTFNISDVSSTSNVSNASNTTGARKITVADHTANVTNRSALQVPPVYSMYEMVQRMANFFRIYPVASLPLSGEASLVSAKSKASAELGRECHATTLRVNVKSKAWLANVVDKIEKRATIPFMTTWFGRSDNVTRIEVLRVLNSADEVLMRVKYVFGSSLCDSNMYGFVYPVSGTCNNDGSGSCSKNKDGQYVINLCPLFCQSSEDIQIETITHEATHHGAAFLDDVPPNPYGREACKMMAKKAPEKALHNADSFCYYVTEINQLTVPLPAVDGPDTCRYARDGQCDEPQYCTAGTDTSDCGIAGNAGNASNVSFKNVTLQPTGPDSCRWAKDGLCDEPLHCENGTDTSDCMRNTSVSADAPLFRSAAKQMHAETWVALCFFFSVAKRA